MNELTKIAYNCKKATFLIEKKQTGKISLREMLELKIHLAGCSVCRVFEKQSLLINQMVRELIGASRHSEIHLDEAYKQQLQEMIDDRMDSKN